jgi:hypothetical protein
MGTNADYMILRRRDINTRQKNIGTDAESTQIRSSRLPEPFIAPKDGMTFFHPTKTGRKDSTNKGITISRLVPPHIRMDAMAWQDLMKHFHGSKRSVRPAREKRKKMHVLHRQTCWTSELTAYAKPRKNGMGK